MASELIVQTIQGPSSGANANKVIIPSGHTLSAAGHVIQVKTFTSGSSLGTINTTTFADILSCSFTTKEDGSLVVISGAAPLYTNDSSAIWSGSNYIQLVRGSSVLAGYEHPGPKNTLDEFSSSSAVEYAETLATAGTYTYKIQARMTTSGGYLQYNRNTAGALSSTRLTIMEIAQ